MNTNKTTGKAYEGRNQVELEVARVNRGYQSSEWLTFLQAQSIGLKIKKGSVGVSIFKGFESFTEEDKNGKVKTVSRPLGSARVFNLEQTEKFEKK